ncbi:hypothetical protein ACPOLB_20160 [Rubrivivax sp. RP6-9]|uniref:hypothetical protein n=1 Tax=Rubrivivax sp. RP6-9 TaxID=3415750 RepID=UPI003CC5AC7D
MRQGRLGWTLVALLAALPATGCGDAVTDTGEFDRQRWAAGHGQYDAPNPRAGMVAALRERHLRVGMPRADVRALLGIPDASAPQRDTWFLGRSGVGPSIETWVVEYGPDGQVLHFGLARS